MDIIPAGNQEAPSDDQKEKNNFKCFAGSGSKYERLRLIDRGAYGEAWLVKRRSDNLLLVAKTLNLEQMSIKEHKYLESEVRCLAACDHFAIVKYYEDYIENGTMLIIMEFADAGNLGMQIMERSLKKMLFDEYEISYTFIQLVLAIDHICRRRMLHRDIKSGNVLLMTTGLVKLADFGFSRQYARESISHKVANTFCGTPYYLAPELWRREKYSKKADVWAMGVLLYEMITLQKPFSGTDMKSLMEAVLNGNVNPMPENCPEGLKSIVKMILVENPNNRPSASEILQLPCTTRILADFEKSVKKSKLITDELKEKIQNNINDARMSLNTAVPTSELHAVGNVNMEIEYQGQIMKESNNVWKDRYLCLKNGALTISLGKGGKEGKPMSVTNIVSLVPVPFSTPKRKGVFSINTLQQKSLWIQAPSEEECFEWIHKIQQAMGVG